MFSRFSKILFSVLLVSSLVTAQSFNSQTGKYIISANQATSEVLGYSDYYFLNASSADASAATTANANWDNCRGIMADSTGLVKIDYVNTQGTTMTEVLMLNGGVIHPVRNVTKLYRYTTGTTAGTAKSYNSSGTVITNAIKLYR